MTVNPAMDKIEHLRSECVDPAVDHLDLGRYYLFHATRADLLQRMGRSADAAEAYRAALAITTNPAERAFLERRRQATAPR
jgi:RNA polymerase sigma-70 factor (ECF subfamily)